MDNALLNPEQYGPEPNPVPRDETHAADTAGAREPSRAVAGETQIPANEEDRRLFSHETFRFLDTRGAKIRTMIFAIIGNRVRRERDHEIPDAKLLRRDAEGKVAREEVEAVIADYEKVHGEGSAAFLMTPNAHRHFMKEGLGREFSEDDIRRISGKTYGVTLSHLIQTVDWHRAAKRAARQKALRKAHATPDGNHEICKRCARIFSPDTRLILIDGKPLVDKETRIPVITGCFLVSPARDQSPPAILPICRSCQYQLRHEAPDPETRRALQFVSRAATEQAIHRYKEDREFAEFNRSVYEALQHAQSAKPSRAAGSRDRPRDRTSDEHRRSRDRD